MANIKREDGTITVELYWDDLTPETQKTLEEEFGDNGNWDVIPICTMEFDEEALK